MASQLQEIQCGACGAGVTVKIDQPKILNMEHITLMVFEHDGQTSCRCGAVIVPSVRQLSGVGWWGLPLTPEKQNKVIIPAGGPILEG